MNCVFMAGRSAWVPPYHYRNIAGNHDGAGDGRAHYARQTAAAKTTRDHGAGVTKLEIEGLTLGARWFSQTGWLF